MSINNHDTDRFIVKRANHFNFIERAVSRSTLSHVLNGATEVSTATVFLDANGDTIPATVAKTTAATAAVGVVETTSAAAVTTVKTTTTVAKVTTSAKSTTTAKVVKSTTSAVVNPKAGATSSSSSATSSSADSSNTTLPSTVNDSTTSKSHTGTIVAVVVVVLVLLGLVVAFFAYRRVKKNRAQRGSGTAFASSKKSGGVDEDFGSVGVSAGGGEKGYGAIGVGNGGSRLGNQLRQSWQQQQNQQQAYPPPVTTASSVNLLDSQSPMMGNGRGGPSPFDDPPVMLVSGNVGNSRPISPQPQSQQSQKRLPSSPQQPQSQPQGQRQSVQGPFGESGPEQGRILIVKNTFEPTQPDELIIYPGDRIQLLALYDDMWALGINLDSGNPPNKGVFPYDCVGEPTPISGSISAPNLSSTAFHQQHQHDDSRSNSPIIPQPQSQQSRIPSPIPLPLPSPILEEEPRTSSDSQELIYNSSRGEEAPQLAPLRTDSPLGASFASLHPAIQVSDDGGSGASTLLAAAPLPESLQVGHGRKESESEDLTGGKRSSSLVASRDASLFVALGEVLGRDDVRS